MLADAESVLKALGLHYRVVGLAAGDPEAAPETAIEGFFMGLAKRSVQLV